MMKKKELINNVVVQVPEVKCTGCNACINACPHNALIRGENELGHFLPRLLQENCMDCGICVKTCPSLNLQQFYFPIKAYAAWAKSLSEHISSTSGGLASLLIKSFIESKNIVYCCAFRQKPEISHFKIVNFDNISLIKGSKYVQSDIGETYRSIQSDLNNHKVLFIGTPCQVAGLKNFLHKDFDNLLCVALVCHGVPPQKLLFEHLNYRNIPLSTIDNIQFRCQDDFQYKLKVWANNTLVYNKTIFQDLYYSAYNDCLIMRESCVNCIYAKPERCEDITLGDFHQLGKIRPFNENPKGNVSLILINTKKGDNYLDSFSKRDDFVLIQREIEEALAGNPQLQKSSKRRANYDLFKKLYPKIGFDKAAKICLYKRFLKNLFLQSRIKN